MPVRTATLSVCVAIIAVSLLAPAAADAAPHNKSDPNAATKPTDSTPKEAGTPDTPSGPHKDLSSDGVMLDRVVALVNDGLVLDSELQSQTREITTRLR